MARKSSGSGLTITDLFCGAGGSSLGIHGAAEGVEITLALNHWRLAIETHAANFADTAHDCVDVSATDPRRYRSTTVLWASPSCTNHSLAKGQKRRHDAQMELFGKAIADDDAAERSRATMFDVPRFAEYHDYEAIIVENVVDVRHWRLWDAWLHAMHLLGYDHKEVYFNSMFAHLDPAAVRHAHDYAPQSRDRIYIVFWKKGNKAPDLEFRPVGWCDKCARDVEAVQAWKNGRKWGRYRNQYVYRCPVCAAEVVPYHFAAWNAIDWSLPAERIGDRARPLQARTMERIRKGLERYGNTWLVLDTAYAAGDRSRPMLAALPTQTGRQTLGMVAPQLVSVNDYDDRTIPVTERPMGTQTTQNKFGLLMPQIITLRNHGEAEGVTDGPLPTFAAAGNHVGLLMPQLMALGGRQNRDESRAAAEALPTQTGTETFGLLTPFYLGYANGEAPAHGVDEALPTLPGGRTPALVMPFLTSYYGTGGDGRAVGEEMGTLTAADRHGLVMPAPLMVMNYSPGYTRPATEPAGSITASDRHAVLFPAAPPAVEDCGFRMLQPHEVGRGMAFPDEYRVLGNKRDRVRQFGNAVTPPVAKMIMRRVLPTLS